MGLKRINNKNMIKIAFLSNQIKSKLNVSKLEQSIPAYDDCE